MADSDKDVLITPNTSQTSQPEVKFVGKDNSPMYLKVLDDNTLSFEGTEGQVFSISPTMSSGDIFSVNDISGIQSIAVNADGTVALAPVSGNVGIGTTSPSTTLDVAGTIEATQFRFNSNLRIGNPAANEMAIFTAGTERMRFDPSGNVGIGTTAPETVLHLETSSGQIMQLGTGNTAYSLHFADDRAMFGHAGGFATVQGGSGGKAVRFCVNNGTFGSGEAMRIDSTGKVGIGTTSAMNKLQVDHTGADGDDGIMIVRADGTTTSNEILGGIGFDSTDGNVPSSVLEASVAIIGRAREDHGTGDKGGYLDFYYTPTDANQDTASRRGMRMMQGKLSVGGQNDDVGDPINSLVVEHAGSDWHNGVLILRDDTSISSGDLLGAVGFDGKDGNNPSNILEASAGIAAYASQDHSASDKGGHLAFFTSPNDQAADTTSIERMRIKQGGTIEFKDDNANKTVKIHADTNSSPAPRLELMRGTHDTWGTGDDYTDWRIENSNDLIFYSGFSSQSSGAAVERFRIHSDADGVTINDAYKFPASDGSANQVLQTDGNGALSFATVSGGGSDTFVIVGEEGDLYAGTGSTGNANGYQFSYGNGRANVQNSSSGTDFGINVPVGCTLTRIDVVFGNNGNVSSGTTTFVVVKNGSNQAGNLSTTHSSGVHDTHHTGLPKHGAT
jgi:hypothetical protein